MGLGLSFKTIGISHSILEYPFLVKWVKFLTKVTNVLKVLPQPKRIVWDQWGCLHIFLRQKLTLVRSSGKNRFIVKIFIIYFCAQKVDQFENFKVDLLKMNIMCFSHFCKITAELCKYAERTHHIGHIIRWNFQVKSSC